MPQASTEARPLPRTGRVPYWRCSLSRQSEVILNSHYGNGQKIAPPGARCQSAARTKPIGVGGLKASKRFLGVDAIRLSGDRRLQAERTKAGVQLPMRFMPISA